MDNIENEGNEKDLEINIEESAPALEPKKAEVKKEEAKTQVPSPAASRFIDPPKIDNISSLASEDSQPKPEEKKIKKFVVHINAENVEYFESISAEERSQLINTYIDDKITHVSKERKKKFVAKLLKHALTIVITLIIGFPIIFYLVNKSITSTIKSYKYMQVNFEKLYQEKAMKKSL